MKTAMQLLFEKFDRFPEEHFLTYLKVNREGILEKEKKQIIDAYEWGLIDGEKEAKREQKYDHSGSSFYDDFYNPNK